MPSTLLQDAWVKIDSGLKAARVPDLQLQRLKETFFTSMSDAQASKIVNGISFNFVQSKIGDAPMRRNLARAMNCVLGVKAFESELPYAPDIERRKKILDAKTPLEEAKAAVRKEAESALGASGRGAGDMMPVKRKPDEVSIAAGVSNNVILAGPLSRKYDPAVRARWQGAAHKVIRLNQAAAAFATEGAAREGRVRDFVENQTESVGHAWQAACRGVSNVITDQKDWFLYNYTSFNASITAAYQRFELNVRDNQAAIAARVDLVGKLFSALKYAPAPMSLIGTIGEKAMGQLTVDAMLDPRSSFQAIKGDSAGFMGKLADKLDAYHEAVRVGPALANLATVSSVKDGLDKVCAAQLQGMQKILREVCDEHFGDESMVLDRIRNFKTAAVQSDYSNIKGRVGTGAGGVQGQVGRRNIELSIVKHITQYKEELIAQMKTALKAEPAHVPAEDMQAAVEMLLYCSYISALFAREADFKTKPLADGIVNFFAQEGPWGVLSNNSHHAESGKMHRLSWKGGANHKKTLLMFCRWYALNVNPFMMVAGAHVNGVRCTPKSIQDRCAAHIDKVNTAVNSGRSKWALGSAWDWKKINASYGKP